MGPYDHGRAYLHSRSLRWSYGAMKGRSADAWQKAASDQPSAAMLRSLALAGFSGVYVDRAGFDDRGLALEAGLVREAGAAAIESGDHRLAFYDLRPFATALRDRLGPESWAEARSACLDAVTATWLGGFLDRVDGPDGSWSRACAPAGPIAAGQPLGSAAPGRAGDGPSRRRRRLMPGPDRLAGWPRDLPARRPGPPVAGRPAGRIDAGLRDVRGRRGRPKVSRLPRRAVRDRRVGPDPGPPGGGCGGDGPALRPRAAHFVD